MNISQNLWMLDKNYAIFFIEKEISMEILVILPLL